MVLQKIIKWLIPLVFLTLLFVFCFSWFHYQATPVSIYKYLLAHIGTSVGVSLSVPENPFNNLVRQFQEKEADLKKREQKIDEILIKTERETKIILTLVLVLTIILVILILLNFYLDYQSRKIQKT